MDFGSILMTVAGGISLVALAVAATHESLMTPSRERYLSQQAGDGVRLKVPEALPAAAPFPAAEPEVAASLASLSEALCSFKDRPEPEPLDEHRSPANVEVRTGS